jgi:alginate O-acetyltransferase complex protein AlgJ
MMDGCEPSPAMRLPAGGDARGVGTVSPAGYAGRALSCLARLAMARRLLRLSSFLQPPTRDSLSKSMMLIGLALLWLPAANYCWKAASPKKWRSTPLSWETNENRVKRSLKTFKNRTWQNSLARTIGPSFPLFNNAVKLHNQIVYSVFGVSTSHHVLLGKDGYLHNPFYAKAYCSRDLAGSADALRQWAQKIRDMQDIVTARGQIFLYVLTPSKIEHLPETLPAAYPCQSPDRDRFTAAALTYLDAAGVKYLDVTATMEGFEEKYGYGPFPRYGIHWTQLGGYPGALAIIRAINAAKGKAALMPFEIAVSPAKVPVQMDYDYAFVLNIRSTPKPKDTAAFSVTTPAPSQCPPPVSIIAVGGSFFQALGENLSLSPCPPNLSQLFYLTRNTYRYEGGKYTVVGPPDYELLKQAEVVIVEENVGALSLPHLSRYHKHFTAEQPISE